MKKELWAPIEGYENRYLISTYGRVKSLRKTKVIILKPWNLGGYLAVDLRDKPKRKTKTVHRLVAEAFVIRHIRDTEVNHIDGNKLNNRHVNLQWCTHSENIQHAYDTGLKYAPQRDEHSRSKLNSGQVLRIKRLYKTGVISHSELSRAFIVSHATISRVIKSK